MRTESADQSNASRGLQCERENIAARSAFSIHRARSHNQGMGGSRPPDSPSTILGSARAAAAPYRRPGCCTPRSNRVAAVRDPLARTETARPREQPDVAGRRIKRRLHSPERVLGYPVVSAVVIEGAHSRPLGGQQVQTGAGDRAPLTLGKVLGLGQTHPVLPDQWSGRPRPGRWSTHPHPPLYRRSPPDTVTTAAGGQRSSARPIVIGAAGSAPSHRPGRPVHWAATARTCPRRSRRAARIRACPWR